MLCKQCEGALDKNHLCGDKSKDSRLPSRSLSLSEADVKLNREGLICEVL